ncbi:hypothetical protein ANCCEY_01167 [Ancylostoma ceylanicum]|uniref:Uncharacterized protein n=1 Tax=Ancylostoma ceylanicum TaxID=53326 RepID=A0A0D6M8K1_9BILA|nr:hypothetical protein ANCCEY_01167 [Ancylostoma ceylanicum]
MNWSSLVFLFVSALVLQCTSAFNFNDFSDPIKRLKRADTRHRPSWGRPPYGGGYPGGGRPPFGGGYPGHGRPPFGVGYPGGGRPPFGGGYPGLGHGGARPWG